jgi:hypothetical protein
LVESCLNAIAFTSRVPRQEDVGHDFFCILSKAQDGLVWAGPSFTVQAKSDCRPLVFEKPHQVRWVTHLENPFFIAVGDRGNLQIEIYSTWARLNGFLRKAARKITLKPGLTTPGLSNPWTADDGSEQIIALGEPIIRATVGEFLDEHRAEELRDILWQWIVVDRQNIVNSETGMYWVTGPQTYTTNQPIAPGSPFVVWAYSNAQNLQSCSRNFDRAATALRLTIRHRYGPDRERAEFGPSKLDAVDNVLRAWWPDLEGLSRGMLRKWVGLDPIAQMEDGRFIRFNDATSSFEVLVDGTWRPGVQTWGAAVKDARPLDGAQIAALIADGTLPA